MTSAGQGYPPPGPGRLSLRSRLLIGLIAITAIFLVIMGAVSALVLRNHLAAQVNVSLADAVARPRQASSPVIVAVIDPFTHSADVIRGDTTIGNQLAARFDAMPLVRLRLLARANPFPVSTASMGSLRVVIRFERAKRRVLVAAYPLNEVSAAVRNLVVTELITGGVLLALLAVAGRWLIGRGLAPLGRMATAAGRITRSGDLSARMPDADSGTETGLLAGAINTMLDRIQHAFTARWHSEQKVRTFAADASHELRTPLTTIRGYAELYRQGALGPDELPNAMRRIEEEAARMSLLVAELLELARLDRTSSLNLTECDLAAIVADAAADAAAVEPGRPIKVEAPDRLIAVADEPRIRQVLANLLANVRNHTAPSTAVVIRLARADRGTMIEVADAGPGMSAEDAARAFDRFHRGPRGTGPHPAGGSGGAGLGLSIVQAIAIAHGGHAMLESAPGRGTVVRIWLPRTS
ncbi:MAG: sensor histidine kinase [Micromonosporaceae bacterium]